MYNQCCCRMMCCMPMCCGCGCNGGGTTYVLGGTIYGVDGAPVAGMTVHYTIDGAAYTTTTAADGSYTIEAPEGSNVVITPQPGLGVTVDPTSYTVSGVDASVTDLDFYLSVVGSTYTASRANTLTNRYSANVYNGCPRSCYW